MLVWDLLKSYIIYCLYCVAVIDSATMFLGV